jgi:hypothetical protein
VNFLIDLVNWLRQFVRQHFGKIAKSLGATSDPTKPTPKPLTTYQSGPLPVAPVKWQPFRLLNWGPYGNDSVGDCVFAAAAHCWMALSRLLRQPWRVTRNEVVASYKTYCDSYNNGQDIGSIPDVVLQDWHTKGMWGTKLDAWAPINHKDLGEVEQVLHSYGALMVCIQLPKPAYTYQMGANYVRFRLPTWKLTGTPDDNVIVGGHEIAAIGYDAQYIYAVTWGVVVRITHAWWLKYVTEACAVVVPAVVKAGGFNGLNVDSLVTDLAALPQ